MIKRLVFLAALIAGLPAFGATRYVSTSGLPTATCGVADPCDLATGIAGAACGDVVRASAGTYLNVSETISQSCPDNNRLVIESAARDTAILQAESGSNGAFWIQGDGITVQSFRVTVASASGYGFRTWPTASNVTFQSMTIELAGAGSTGINLFVGTGYVVDGVTISRTSPYPVPQNDGSVGVGGATEFSAADGYSYNNVTIQNSTFRNLWEAISIGHLASTGYIQDNTLIDIWDHSIKVRDSNGLVIQRNVHYGTRNPATGAEPQGDFSAIWCSRNINIRNNTIWSNGYVQPVVSIFGNHSVDGICNDDAPPNYADTQSITIQNNIMGFGGYSTGACIDSKTGACTGTPCANDSYNLQYLCGESGNYVATVGSTGYTMTQWKLLDYDGNGALQGIGSIASPPLLVDPLNGNMNLSAGSPAIDTGTNSNCANTIVNGTCDMGAFEYQGTVTSRDQVVTDCSTETGLENAIVAINALAAGGPSSITFDCPAGTVLPITGSRYANRTITQSGVTVNGASNVTFSMTPPWWDAILTLCAGANCDPDGDNIPNACPDTNDGTTNMWLFQTTGTGNTFSNFTYRYFMEGMRVQGSGTALNALTGIMPGDENLSNPGGFNFTLTGGTYKDACDKNLQIYGDAAAGSSTYDSVITGASFLNSSSHVRTSGTDAAGRHYFSGNTFSTGTGGDAPPSSLFTARGPYFGDDGTSTAAVVYWVNNTVSNTQRGLRLSGGTQFISLGGNVFTGNSLRGLSVYANARAIVLNDTFTNNGGSSTSGDAIQGYGGIAVGQSAIVNAGCLGTSGTCPTLTLDGSSRSSSGGNTFSGNRSSTDTTLDFHNLLVSTMYAENNCWTNNSNVADSITGVVDYSPAGACGSLANSSTLRGVAISGGTLK